MAAPIKVDELLVSFWLGSDEVYENVLNLIEKYRMQRQQQQEQELQQLQQQQQSQQQHHEQQAQTKGPSALKNVGGGVGEDVNDNDNDNNSERSPRGVMNMVIPPFYPLQTATGTKIQRRRQLPRQFETWDRLPDNAAADADAATAAVQVPPLPKKQQPPPSKKKTSSQQLLSSDDDLPDDEQQEDQQAAAAAALCVKDQVQNLIPELVELTTMEPTAAGDDVIIFSLESFVRITKEICNFPSFFNGPLYQRILDLWNVAHKNQTQAAAAAAVSLPMLEWFWKTEMEPYDPPERFFRLVKQPHNDCILRDDFLPYIKALLNDHPGLEFLSNHAEFQEKYAVTVITRIFYSVNKCHSGRITSRQVRRSDLLSAFAAVDEEEDINKVTRYFSYEHFYVLYCRFWELDHDRDYRITREDLLKYGDHSLSHMIVDRIFDAAPRPFFCQDKNNSKVDREFLSYEDFIYFMLSEEDKANDVSVRYWFACVDVDGDAKLNNMEMRSFYAVQLHRMQCMGHEIVPFEDMLCQMMDMIKPASNDHLIVEDFLQPECSNVSGALFDALFNLNKYLMFEQRDPFVERQKREDEFETDWDRFACIDYNRLAMEEEAREEENELNMEIDWVNVDEDEEEQQQQQQFSGGPVTTESPF